MPLYGCGAGRWYFVPTPGAGCLCGAAVVVLRPFLMISAGVLLCWYYRQRVVCFLMICGALWRLSVALCGALRLLVVCWSLSLFPRLSVAVKVAFYPLTRGGACLVTVAGFPCLICCFRQINKLPFVLAAAGRRVSFWAFMSL